MITNSDQMKHTCHSKEYPNSHINIQCNLSLAVIEAYILVCKWSWSCRMSFCGRLSHASCTRCRSSEMVVAGSGERASFCFIMSHMCSIGERSRDRVRQGRCCTPRRACYVAAAICRCVLSCWKNTSPSCRRNGSSTRLTICAMQRALFTLACRNTKCDHEL